MNSLCIPSFIKIDVQAFNVVTGDTHTDRQQGHLISQVAYFQNKESRPKENSEQFYSNLGTAFLSASAVS
jgi:hypothetical protein